jgi:hypothetical protein
VDNQLVALLDRPVRACEIGIDGDQRQRADELQAATELAAGVICIQSG